MADGTPNPNYTGPTPGPASQYDPRGYLQPGQTPTPAPAGYGDKPTDTELQAIRERATAAGKKPTDQDVLDTWNANKAKQIVSQYGDNPTQAELDAIKQRAIAAGKKPTDPTCLPRGSRTRTSTA
jgi:hypothetical protein